MSATIIAGRYELGERLGYGGMSTVQVAMDRVLEREVAVKLLAEHLSDDSQFISRFKREALSAAKLVHPNIVQVFDFGFDEDSGHHYIVMEYIRGRSGAEILREETRLGVKDTLELVDGACRGLAHAHRMGVIHRDVKPGNILRSDDGAVKLADFGIAKAMVGGTSQITQAGSVLGTAAYLAPEQASGAEVGPQADLYGLGVVTYQLLAGRLPYDASSLTELALMQQRQYPARLDEVAPDVPAALGLAVERALELEPSDRYAKAEDMRRALHDGAKGVAPAGGEDSTAATSMLPSGEPTAATRAVPSARRLQPQAPRTPPPPLYAEPDVEVPMRSRRNDPPPRRGGMARIVAIILAVALVAAAIAFAYGNSSGGSGKVRLSPVDGDSVGKITQQATELIDNNTR
ncbi:MAG: eukaryotic-like serine/threonine-protein kinase [bacterium]